MGIFDIFRRRKGVAAVLIAIALGLQAYVLQNKKKVEHSMAKKEAVVQKYTRVERTRVLKPKEKSQMEKAQESIRQLFVLSEKLDGTLKKIMAIEDKIEELEDYSSKKERESTEFGIENDLKSLNDYVNIFKAFETLTSHKLEEMAKFNKESNKKSIYPPEMDKLFLGFNEETFASFLAQFEISGDKSKMKAQVKRMILNSLADYKEDLDVQIKFKKYDLGLEALTESKALKDAAYKKRLLESWKKRVVKANVNIIKHIKIYEKAIATINAMIKAL